MKVAFRVDASTEIGSGHLMRCLTLADACRQQGAGTLFLCRELSGFPEDLVASRGHSLCLLPKPEKAWSGKDDGDPAHAGWVGASWRQDADQTLRLLVGTGTDLLVVDHYGLDARWEERVKTQVEKVMVIDDLADRSHDCELLLDQTLAASEVSYTHLVPDHCRLLLGPGYALLRPQFAALRKQALERRRHLTSVKRVLVTMGAMDPDDLTTSVLKGLKGAGPFEMITAVLGSNAPHLQALQSQAEQQDFRLFSGVADMARLMLEHDLCIGCGGTSAWERCAMGLPTVLISCADNQDRVGEKLHEREAVLFLGKKEWVTVTDIRSSVKKMTKNIDLYKRISIFSSAICDGNGVDKIIDIIFR